MLKGGTRNYIVINNQSYTSWLSKKRGHQFFFTKSLLKEAAELLLYNCFFSIGNIIIIQVIGIPMGCHPAPFLPNTFLVHKEADWVKAQRKLGTINVRNVDSTFEKHYKDIYPGELELKKESNSNFFASFLEIYIYIKNGEFNTKLFEK